MMRPAAAIAMIALAAMLAGCGAADPDEEGPAASPSPSAAVVDPDRPLEDQLLDAIRAGDVPLMRLLFEAGADASAPFDGGNAPLHLAVLRDDPEMLAVVLEAGADVNAIAGNRYHAVNLACRSASAEVLELLLDAGAGTDAASPDNVGSYPVHECAADGDLLKMELLLAAGADVNQRQAVWEATPLAPAAWAGQEQMVVYLINRGADVTLTDRDGTSAADWAFIGGNRDLATLLIEYGDPRGGAGS